MIKKNIKKVFGAALAVAFAFLSVSATATIPVHADEGGMVESKGARIGVTPVVEKVSLSPGEEYTGTFKVVNGSEDMDFKYKVYATPYQVKDKNYSTDFVTTNAYTKLAEWITFDKDGGSVNAKSTDTVTYTIKVPQDVPAGGQYAAIMAELDNSEKSSVQTTSRAALTVYAHIAGQTRQEGTIKENNVPGMVFGGNKITTTSLVENKGNIDVDATYTLKVFPFGSSEEIYTNEDSPTVRTILPETERYNTMIWEETPQLGLYTVEQTIEYMGTTSTTSKLVLVCPIWLIVLFIALILAIIFTVVSRVRSRKQESGSRSSESSSTHRSQKKSE